MTLCAVVNWNGRGICLVADSVVTTTERRGASLSERTRIDPRGTDVAGRTSKDEAYQPLSHDGGVDYFEIACKLTHLGLLSRLPQEVLCRLLSRPRRERRGVRLDEVEAHVRAPFRAADRFEAPPVLSAEALLCGKTRAGALAIFKIKIRCEHATHHVVVILNRPISRID
jgi:hypothetical protein